MLRSIHMWEYPDSFGYRFSVVEGLNWTPNHQPWLYAPLEENHPWFEHHERGSNRTVIYNMTASTWHHMSI